MALRAVLQRVGLSRFMTRLAMPVGLISGVLGIYQFAVPPESEVVAVPVPVENPAPEWVRRGCDAYWREADPARVCGVGVASAGSPPSMARSQALLRAQAEIARALAIDVAKTLDRDGLVVETRSNATLEGVELRETWLSPGDELHVLAVYYAPDADAP